ncbi:hypothetical protein TNCV_2452811 [Trichonephila clavipes]|nr:hypothetical protein TNCV_2452811 [Trichonephila clavipes]
MAPWTRRLGCVLACYARIGRGRSRDFGDLRIRRSEGRVVNTPLVFKRVLFQAGKERSEGKDKRVRERERTEGGGEMEKIERRRKESRGERESEARLEWRKGLSPRLE